MSQDTLTVNGYPAEAALARLRAAGHRITTARRLLLAENRALRHRYGFILSQHRFAITGRCAQCQ